MKIYTIIAGVNGAGKSSLIGVLLTEMTNLGKVIDVDKMIAKCGGNVIGGGKQSIALIDECLEKEICFTQETTLSDHRILGTIKKALDKGYYIRLYYVVTKQPFMIMKTDLLPLPNIGMVRFCRLEAGGRSGLRN